MLNINEYLINKTTTKALTFDEFIDEINKNWKGRLHIIDKIEHQDRGYTTVILSNHAEMGMGVPYIRLEYSPKEYGENLKQITVPHSMSDPNSFFITVYYNKHIKVKDIDPKVCSFKDEKDYYRIALFPLNTKTLEYLSNILKKHDNA